MQLQAAQLVSDQHQSLPPSNFYFQTPRKAFFRPLVGQSLKWPHSSPWWFLSSTLLFHHSTGHGPAKRGYQKMIMRIRVCCRRKKQGFDKGGCRSRGSTDWMRMTWSQKSTQMLGPKWPPSLANLHFIPVIHSIVCSNAYTCSREGSLNEFNICRNWPWSAGWLLFMLNF